MKIKNLMCNTNYKKKKKLLNINIKNIIINLIKFFLINKKKYINKNIYILLIFKKKKN
ncbi:MAG: hypothetical protein NHF93_00540 [Candidatus Shikimatogenerans bostrichidophilus]|nr:MAG: hypothetical protein NHF93_00540 [Candidatus Shikimatogenerans bostrichidophilus]